MNPLSVVSLVRSNWQLILLAVLLAGNALFYSLWQDTKAEYIAYGAGVEALGKDALADKERKDKDHKANLEIIKHEFEAQLPEIRAGAVAAYRAAHPQRLPIHTGQGAMPGIAPRQPGNDGTGPEPLPIGGPGTCDDDQFIADAAHDALIREQWRAYCIRNQCPIE